MKKVDTLEIDFWQYDRVNCLMRKYFIILSLEKLEKFVFIFSYIYYFNTWKGIYSDYKKVFVYCCICYLNINEIDYCYI